MTHEMLDLFSGLGGASEAMLNHGWDVLRIENNPELALVPNKLGLGRYPPNLAKRFA